MKMERLIRLCTLTLLFSIFGEGIYAQDHFFAGGNKTGDDLYANYQFPDAIDYYKKQLGNRKSDQKLAIQRIADSYRKTGKYSESEEWYAQLVLFQDIEPEYYYYYAKALTSNRKYEQAAEWFKRYEQINRNNSGKAKLARDYSLEEISVLLEDRREFAIYPVSENTEHSEFSPFVLGDKVIFLSDRPEGNSSRTTYGWTEQKYLDIYEAKAFAGRFSEVSAVSALNTPYHEGPVTLTKDQKRIYLTTNTQNDRNKLIRDGANTTHLQISAANLITVEGKTTWSTPIPLSFNSPNYSCMHPTLSADGKYLYFASDMPGGQGGLDIWVCENLLLSWSKPRNLGPEINTATDEAFPFIAADGSLYFSSNGLLGLGGLDIFKASPKSNKATYFNKPTNMGAPINDVNDDFGLVYITKEEYGYFSSNRPGGKGRDDIYYFEKAIPEEEEAEEAKSMISVKLLEVRVFEKQSNEGLPNAVVNVFDERGKLVTAIQVNDSGYFQTEFDLKKYKGDLRFIASYGNYATQREIVNMQSLFNKDRSMIEIALYRDLGKELKLNPIYFDFNKDNIRRDAAMELDKIVNIMQSNVSLVIELGSHTDSRGTKEYNQALSDRRARSSVGYIVYRGVENMRIYGKGFGESQLVNNCEDGVPCTEEEHQLNRRTEFKVVKGSLRQ